MTALTQYFKSCYYKFIPQNKDKILKGIQAKLKELTKVLNTDKDFVVDFVYSDDEIMIIELNPYGMETASGLFSWRDETDKKVLLGESPFEFRILEKPLTKEEERSSFSKDIRDLLETIDHEHLKDSNCLIN